MRALRRDVLPRLDLRTTGMEFASEMVIRASKEQLRIAEFPIEYHPRSGESKLSTFSDGWRHLRFLLVHSPNHLFILPGAVMASFGTLILALVVSGLDLFGRAWGMHALIGGALLMIVGTQVLALGLCAHAYGTYFMGEKDPWFDRMRARFRLEDGLRSAGSSHSPAWGWAYTSSSPGSTMASGRWPTNTWRSWPRRCSSSGSRSSSPPSFCRYSGSAAASESCPLGGRGGRAGPAGDVRHRPAGARTAAVGNQLHGPATFVSGPGPGQKPARRARTCRPIPPPCR